MNHLKCLTYKTQKNFNTNPQRSPLGGKKSQTIGLGRMTKINIALSISLFLGTSLYLYFNKKTKQDGEEAQKKVDERKIKENEIIQRDIKYLQELSERRKQTAKSILGKGDTQSE